VSSAFMLMVSLGACLPTYSKKVSQDFELHRRLLETSMTYKGPSINLYLKKVAIKENAWDDDQEIDLHNIQDYVEESPFVSRVFIKPKPKDNLFVLECKGRVEPTEVATAVSLVANITTTLWFFGVPTYQGVNATIELRVYRANGDHLTTYTQTILASRWEPWGTTGNEEFQACKRIAIKGATKACLVKFGKDVSAGVYTNQVK